MAEQDGLGGLREQIDNRRASQAEGLGVHSEFERLAAVVAFERRNEKHDLGRVAEPGGANAIEPLQVEEEKFLREAEIFLQKAVADEGAARIGQHPIFFGKANRTTAPRAEARPAGAFDFGVVSRTTI